MERILYGMIDTSPKRDKHIDLINYGVQLSPQVRTCIANSFPTNAVEQTLFPSMNEFSTETDSNEFREMEMEDPGINTYDSPLLVEKRNIQRQKLHQLIQTRKHTTSKVAGNKSHVWQQSSQLGDH